MGADFLRCGRLSLAGIWAGGPNIKSALLGKAPRYAPDRAFDTLHVALDLSVDFARRSVSGTCRTRLCAFRGALRHLEFDAVDLRVSQVLVDGRPARFSCRGGKLVATLSRALARSQQAEVLFRYRVDKPKAGLHFVYPGPHNPGHPLQVWSQSQPEDARYWFPCHDDPHEKATSEVRATVPRGFMAVSNGRLLETIHRKSRSTYHWRMEEPHALYLISLAAGRFSEIRDRWEDVPILYYCEKGREAEARRGFAKTPKAMAFFSAATGIRYPYGKYAQVAVAEYPGGMENTTCTTQTDAILIPKRAALDNDLDLLVAHELAHQWFGDLVTCRDWSHAWLNEGFATYFEILFQGHDKGQDEADYELFQAAASYFDEDSKRYRRPIVCPTYKAPWTLFDRHTYEKGAWVLRMLHQELGAEIWSRTIERYLRRFRGKSVETRDLIETIEEVSGRNLRAFFDQWVFKSGYPAFRAHYHWDARARKAGLWVLQTQEVSEENPLFKATVEIRLTGRGWKRRFTEKISEREHRFSWRLSSEPLNLEFDPQHHILKKLSLRKPQAMWRYQLLNGESAWSRHEAAARVAHWGDELSAALLEKAIRREPFWGAACEMIRALGSVEGQSAFARLKGLLTLPHPKMRRAVVEVLARYSRPETAGLLAPLIGRDRSLRVRAEACRSLGRLGERRYGRLLRRQLARPSYRDMISAGALAGLCALREPSTLALLRRMSLPPQSFYRRVQAIRSLSEYATISADVVPWLCANTSDPDERINIFTIGVLGQLEDERALPTLEAAKKSPNTRVRVYAEEAIAHIRAGVEPKKSRKLTTASPA